MSIWVPGVVSRFSVNSDIFNPAAGGEPGAGTSLISTKLGSLTHGEASMLRISVDTRAFDCA